MSGSYDTDLPPCTPTTRLTHGWTPIKLTRYYDGHGDVLTYHRLSRDETDRMRDEWRQLVYHPARGFDRVGSQDAPALAWIDTPYADEARHLYHEVHWRMDEEQWSLMSQPLIFDEEYACDPSSAASVT